MTAADDQETDTMHLVSANLAGTDSGDGASGPSEPAGTPLAFSPDGRQLAFVSTATDLTTISVKDTRPPAPGRSTPPGLRIAFAHPGSDLLFDPDTNEASDIFLSRLLNP
jgi:hypothetical protein